MTERELLAILEASRRHNTRNNITGMLLFGDGAFLQVLEGDPITVEATYRRIEADPRHHGIIIVEDTQIDERDFGPWSMAFRYFEREELAMVERLRPLTANLRAEIAATSQSPVIRGMVDTFMRNQTRDMVRPSL